MNQRDKELFEHNNLDQFINLSEVVFETLVYETIEAVNIATAISNRMMVTAYSSDHDIRTKFILGEKTQIDGVITSMRESMQVLVGEMEVWATHKKRNILPSRFQFYLEDLILNIFLIADYAKRMSITNDIKLKVCGIILHDLSLINHLIPI